MKRPTDDPLAGLDPDIAEVLMSRLDFHEDPEEAGPEETVEEEPVEEEPKSFPKVIRATTGNRVHVASAEAIQKLADEHGLTLAAAGQVATGKMTIQTAVKLNRTRALQSRRKQAEQESPPTDKRLVFLFVALMAVFVWVLFIQ